MKRFLITAMLLSISAFSYSQIAVGVKVANPFVAVNVMKHQIANTPKGIRNGGGIYANTSKNTLGTTNRSVVQA